MSTNPERIAPADLRLEEVLAHWAQATPDGPALIFKGAADRVVTWKQLDAMAESAAAWIAETTPHSPVVAIVGSDTVEFTALLYGAWKLGLTVIIIDRNWGSAVVADVLAHVGCSVVLHGTNEWEVSAEVACCYSYNGKTLVGRSSKTRLFLGEQSEIALLATTSGTTSDPKCVAVAHRKLRAAYRTCLAVHDLGKVARSACLLAVNSLGVLGICFLLPREVGAATCVYPTFTPSNIASTWNDVLASADFVYVVPPLVRLLKCLPAREHKRTVLVFCASAPVTAEELAQLESRFGVCAYNCYGLTELTFAVFFGDREHNGSASDSIGYPRGIEAKIVDADGREVVGPGTGELLIRSPSLTNGYVGNPSSTALCWVNGWLRTGDVARRDVLGRYYITGRVKDIVLRGGYTIYLAEVEHYLRNAPGVQDACAFKGRDLPSGDELCVVLQMSEADVDVSDVRQWIDQHMGAGKSPNRIMVTRRSLPRNSNGKVMRSEVIQRTLAGGHYE